MLHRGLRVISQLRIQSRAPKTRLAHSGPRIVMAAPSQIQIGRSFASWKPPSGTSTKYTLEDIATFIEAHDFKKLGRTPDAQKIYEEHLANVRSTWRSIDDFILNTVFKLESSVDSTTGKQYVEVRPDQLPDTVVFGLNDFPYNHEDGVDQHLIWSTRPLTQERIIKALEEHRPPSQWDYVYFENPPAQKSVKSIHHAHVFSRLRPSAIASNESSDSLTKQ